jgi:hypothetical protein
MDHENRTLTLGNSVAGNPGRLRVNYLRWLIHKPTWPLLWAGSAILCTAGALYLHWSWWIPAALLAVWNFLYWVRVREHFWNGNANPGLVVSADPLLIAVATDLTQGVGSYPAVKVFRAGLRHIDGQPPRVGDRVGTVALYSRSPDDTPHWADFDPLPAQYATGDPEKLSALLGSFAADDWARLERFLKQVPQPYRAGLYMIELERKPKKRRDNSA